MKANIIYKSVLKKYKTIEERNKAFNALDPQSQRLEIAWDALNLVLQDKVYASNGKYWGHSLFDLKGNGKSFQKKLINKLPHCAVCQRGLMMLSQIRLGNSINSNDRARINGSTENIKGFSIESFIDMEKEYEKSKFEHPYLCNTEEKLANICCNILINGDFNVDDATDYLTL